MNKVKKKTEFTVFIHLLYLLFIFNNISLPSFLINLLLNNSIIFFKIYMYIGITITAPPVFRGIEKLLKMPYIN